MTSRMVTNMKLTSRQVSHSFGWSAGGCLLPGKLSLHSDKLISCTNNQVACEAGKCPKSAGEAILKRDFPANPGDLATMKNAIYIYVFLDDANQNISVSTAWLFN